MGNRKRAANWAARRAQALALRRAGVPYATIGEQLGISSKRAREIVNSELDKLAAETKADAERVREMEVLRLDRMLFHLWKRMEDGDLDVIQRILRISERRSRLLGLDAPERIEDVTPPTQGGGKVLEITIGGERVEALQGLSRLDPASFQGKIPGQQNGSAPSQNGGPHANGHP